MSSGARDRWAEWLAERRFGGDAEVKKEFLAELAKTRGKVLDNARLVRDQTVLDVGCGEGLIGFGALERGARLVIFSDISQDLLDTCHSLADQLGVLHRCRFVNAPADDLAEIDGESVDVVTTRSVLIYVEDKRRAFEEFHRVLKSGGRLSLFEPINRFGGSCDDGRYWGYDTTPVADLARRLRAVYEAIQPRDSDPMLDFDERDLIALAEGTAFFPIELELRAEIRPHEGRPFETFLRMSGNPNIPTLEEAMREALRPDEQRRFTEHVRPLVEEGRGVWKMATAYLWAEKPRYASNGGDAGPYGVRNENES